MSWHLIFTDHVVRFSHTHKNTILSLEWNRNGNWLLSGSRDQLVKVYDIRTMKELQGFRGHKREVNSKSRKLLKSANTQELCDRHYMASTPREAVCIWRLRGHNDVLDGWVSAKNLFFRV
jgi:WD40 repeat protein